MKVCLTTPNRFGQNGGLKLINDFFKQLLLRGHDAYLMDENAVKCVERVITPQQFDKMKFDLIICCSPHSIDKLYGRNVKQSIVWCQMAEHLWAKNRVFRNKCLAWYKHPEIIVNASWLLDFMPQAKVCRTWLQDSFEWKPSHIKYDILLESPFSKNPTKDIEHLAYRAAQHLQQLYKAKIVGYGKTSFAGASLNKYVVQPQHTTLENLYSQSRLLLKATKFDGASCAPIEAAKYGCVTVRGLDKGDDWLNNEMGYRCEYKQDMFFYWAEKAFLQSKQSYSFNNHENKVKALKQFASQYTFDKFIEDFALKANVPELDLVCNIKF